MDATNGYSALSKDELVLIIKQKDNQIRCLQKQLEVKKTPNCDFSNNKLIETDDVRLSLLDIKRYSRQLILPEFGPTGQIKLKNRSVLIVGCGGLGCPAALYLAAAGIGQIGLVDYDDVELSNLHRQILHTESEIGTSKVFSIMKSLSEVNSAIRCIPYEVALSSCNARKIIEQYDIVIDCSDNVATRYLLNDACVLLNKPLISGSALRFEGQLTVYNYNNGPCYRCLFPEPPPPATVTNCSDGGVVGVIPGVIGVLQALETIKIITSVGTVNNRAILLFNGLDFTFRNVKLREKQKNCAVCGTEPTITGLVDYEMFCGSKATDKEKGVAIRSPHERITVEQYDIIKNTPHVLLDVRLPVELEICALPNSFNVPFIDIDCDKNIKLINEKMLQNNTDLLICICHRGNDSQRSASFLSRKLSNRFNIVDVVGGLDSWSRNIDESFPVC